MSFFPRGYDPGGVLHGVLDLCEIDTSGGVGRFIIGTDGIFVDVQGNRWFGTQLAGVSSLGSALGGQAPEGNVTLSYFQDPDADDLIAKVKSMGVSAIDGRSISFFVQPCRSLQEFYQPKVPPSRWLTRTMRTLSYSAAGAQDRSITIGFEAWTEKRRAAGRLVLNTEGHARLIGHENPSLKHMPTNDFEEEKLFG